LTRRSDARLYSGRTARLPSFSRAEILARDVGLQRDLVLCGGRVRAAPDDAPVADVNQPRFNLERRPLVVGRPDGACQAPISRCSSGRPPAAAAGRRRADRRPRKDG